MTCRDVADFLADYLSGTLEMEIRARFERHLSLCPNCKAYLSTYRATIDVGRSAFTLLDADAAGEFPDELVSAILHAVRQ